MKKLLCAAVIACACSAWLFAATGSEKITLQQAVSTALTSGPGIKVAQLTLDNAGAQLDQAKAQDGFSLSASTGYSHQAKVPGSAASTSTTSSTTTANLPGESADGGVTLSGPTTTAKVSGSYGISDKTEVSGKHAQDVTLGVSLDQTVYDGYPGGRAKATFQKAQYTYQLAQVAYTTAKDNVIYSVEQAYYTMLGAQHTVDLRHATLKQSQEDLARTNAYFKASRVTKLDVLTSQIAEQTAQADLVSAENTLKQDRSSLAVLLGWPIDRQFSVAEVNEPSLPTITEEKAVRTALDDRAELKQYGIGRASTTVTLKNAESLNKPVISVNGGASYDIYPGVTPNENGGTWNAGVTVSVPILDSGTRSSEVSQAEAALSKIGVQEKQEKQNITIDVRKSLFAVKDASVRLKLAKESVTQAQGEYDLEKTKFSAGLASNLDVIDASVTLANAQVSLETAQTNLNLAILNLQQAMGTLSAP